MSTSPYSEDLRKKVINYLKKGRSQKEASEVFGIHRNTISRWNKSYSETGTYAAKERLGYKSKLDDQKIELFVKNNADIKLASIGVQFGISKGHAGLILKKLGFSYKKKPSPTWRQMKESEPSTRKQ